MEKTSEFPGFYKLSPSERLDIIKNFANLSDDETKAIGSYGALSEDTANRMIENVAGTFPMPLGFAVNFRVNKEYFVVPMALEEPSVVAAASNMAKGTLPDGISAESMDPIMIGQIQLVNLQDPFKAKEQIIEKEQEIINLANEQDPILVKFGGGCKDLEARVIDTDSGPMVIIHILVDCRDAMGANAVNTMAEAVAPRLETITGGRVYLRIISNLAIHRKSRASAIWPSKFLGGEEVVDGRQRHQGMKAQPQEDGDDEAGSRLDHRQELPQGSHYLRLFALGVRAFGAILGFELHLARGLFHGGRCGFHHGSPGSG